MKRIVSILLCLTLVFGMMTVTNILPALAAGDGEGQELLLEDAGVEMEGIALDSGTENGIELPIEIDSDEMAPLEAADEALFGDESAVLNDFIVDDGEKLGAVSNVASLTYNVLDYGAVPDDGEDDRKAFNEAFEMALQTDKTITVVIPAGEYMITNGLCVYSDTIVQADANAVIKSTRTNGAILYGAHLDPETGERCSGVLLGGDNCNDHGFGYSKTRNVTIEGGTWECAKGNVGSTVVFAFRHSSDITIKNLICKYAAGHMINFSGTKDSTISGVTFMDAQKSKETKTNYWAEAIHLDYCNEVGEPQGGTPYDNTPAKGITVENCVFSNVHAGVGNHHARPKDGKISSDITVKDCSFIDIEGYAVSNHSVNGMKILNNTADNVGILAFITNSSNVIIKDNVYDAKGKHKYDSISGAGNKGRGAIEIRATMDEGETEDAKESVQTENAVINKVTVEGNTILNARFIGIQVYGRFDVALNTCKSVTLSNNLVKKSNGDGIIIQNARKAKVEKNDVLSSKRCGIIVQSSANTEVISNNVKGTSTARALYIKGFDRNSAEDKDEAADEDTGKIDLIECTGTRIIDNTLDYKNGMELFLSNYAKKCYLSGNVLKHKWLFGMSDTASYTGEIDLAKLGKVKLSKTSYTYDGKPHKPVPTVKDTCGRTLKAEVDYTVRYTNCIQAGDKTANVRILGLGSLFGGQEVQAGFTIKPQSIKKVKVKLSRTSYVYSGDSRKPQATVSILVNGKYKKITSANYTATFPEGRADAGEYVVKVQLKGNYSGSGSASFVINKASNTMIIKDKALNQSVSYNASKAQTIDISECVTIRKAAGKLTFTQTGSNKNVTIDSETGKITVAKGTKKGSTQTVKIQITAEGDKNHKPMSKTKIIKIKVE